MSARIVHLLEAGSKRNATSEAKGRGKNEAYRTREHLTEAEMDKLLVALKRNRYGHRDWLIGLLIPPWPARFRGLRSALGRHRPEEAHLILRRLKGSADSSHYLERDEHKALGELWRTYAAKGIKTGYVFVNERGHPFGRMGIGRMIERAGEAAGLPFSVHVHMLRHSTGYARARRHCHHSATLGARPFRANQCRGSDRKLCQDQRRQSAVWGIGAEQCGFRAGPQPMKCAPVHSLWPCRKRLKQVDAAAQPHPDLPLLQAPMPRRLLLAFVGQAITPAARK